MPAVLAVQHAACETLGTIEDAITARGIEVDCVRPFEDEPLPRDLDRFAGLVVMGGPMGVYESGRYPYLTAGIFTLTIAGADENAAATGDLDITQDVTINGAGAGSTIIDGNGSVIGASGPQQRSPGKGAWPLANPPVASGRGQGFANGPARPPKQVKKRRRIPSPRAQSRGLVACLGERPAHRPRDFSAPFRLRRDSGRK